LTVFYLYQEGTPQAILQNLFRVFDTSGDGKVSFKEMQKLVKAIYGLLKVEDPKVAAEKFLAESTFYECDDDKDGFVSEEEFIKSCLEDNDSFTTLLTLKLVNLFVDTESKMEDMASDSDSD